MTKISRRRARLSRQVAVAVFAISYGLVALFLAVHYLVMQP